MFEDTNYSPDDVREDLALLVLSTCAFNMGIGARADRDQETVDRLELALKRMCVVFNLGFDIALETLTRRNVTPTS